MPWTISRQDAQQVSRGGEAGGENPSGFPRKSREILYEHLGMGQNLRLMGPHMLVYVYYEPSDYCST